MYYVCSNISLILFGKRENKLDLNLIWTLEFCIVMIAASALQVCPILKKHVGHLLSNPSIMLKTWAKYVFTLTPAALPSQRHFSVFISQQIDSCRGKTSHVLLCHCCFRLQPRTEVFLGALVSKRVDCKDSLLSVWKTEDKCEDLLCLAWLQYDFNFAFFCHLILVFCFFFSYSFVVCILPVVTRSLASRSSQKLASDMKAYIWKEGKT